jgi:hypothetical protein
LGKTLFTLTYFHVFCPTVKAHLTYVYPLFTNDMHIIGYILDMVRTFLQLQVKFVTLRLSIQPTKCVAWFP